MKNSLNKERVHYFSPCANIVLAADISGAQDTRALCAAIHMACQSHGILSCAVMQSGDGELALKPVGEQNISVSIVDHCAGDAWKNIIYQNDAAPFDFEHGELVRFFIISGEPVRLVIVAHHMVGDGLSITYLMRDIMQALAHPCADLPQREAGLVCDILPPKAKLPLSTRLLADGVSARWAKTGARFDYAQYALMHKKFWENRSDTVVCQSIEGDALIRLLAACRENDVKFNSVLCTALLTGCPGKTDVGISASVRPRGDESLRNYATGISVRFMYDPSISFWENARFLQKEIYKKLNNDAKKYFLMCFMAALPPTLIDATYFAAVGCCDLPVAKSAADMFGYAPGKAKNISVTNLTRLDIPQSYGRYELKNLTFVPPLPLNAACMVGALTLGDTLTLSMRTRDDEHAGDMRAIFKNAVARLITISGQDGNENDVAK